jgi:DNA-binding transcriptional regulator YiaG
MGRLVKVSNVRGYAGFRTSLVNDKRPAFRDHNKACPGNAIFTKGRNDMTPERFKEIRLRLGIGQKHLAPMIAHTTANKVSAFECGRLEIPLHVAIMMDLYADKARPGAADIVAKIEAMGLAGKGHGKQTAAAMAELKDWILSAQDKGAEA